MAWVARDLAELQTKIGSRRRPTRRVHNESSLTAAASAAAPAIPGYRYRRDLTPAQRAKLTAQRKGAYHKGASGDKGGRRAG